MICLDTNVVIAALGGRFPHVATRLERALVQTDVILPVIVVFELRYGIAKSRNHSANLERLELFLQLPIEVARFEEGDAAEASVIRASLEQMGTPIGPYDLLIAGQARRRGALLVTANQREFTRVPGLLTEDWATP